LFGNAFSYNATRVEGPFCSAYALRSLKKTSVSNLLTIRENFSFKSAICTASFFKKLNKGLTE